MEEFSYPNGNRDQSSHRIHHQQVNSSSSLPPPFESPLATRTRPTSEIFLQTPLKQFGSGNITNSNGMNSIPAGGGSISSLNGGSFNQSYYYNGNNSNNYLLNNNNEDQMMDLAAEKWLADLELYQKTLEEMAEVSLDKDFKNELNDIERWFEVLSVGERTAALYALLQQTTPVQIRFFITVLQKIANRDPISAVLSPTNFDREPLQSQLSEAMARQTSTNSQQQQQQQQRAASPNNSSNSSNSSNPSSTSTATSSKPSLHQPQPHSANFVQNYPHLHSPVASGNGISNSPFMTPPPKNDLYNNHFLTGFTKSIAPPMSPWAAQEINRPKSADAPLINQQSNYQIHSLIQQQQLQLQQLQNRNTAGSRLSNLSITSDNTSTTTPYKHNKSLSVLDDSISSYLPDSSTNWSSIVNTPVSHANTPQQNKVNAEIMNSTAMKMAALSTVNNRVILDSDVKKYRRRASLVSNEDQKNIERELQTLHLKSGNGNLSFGSSTPSPASWTLGVNNNTTSSGSPMPSSKHNNNSTSPQDRKSGLSKVSFGTHERSPSKDRASSPGPKKENPVDIDLLEDVGAWLRSLRLHKYTDNLSGLNWKELVQLTDEDLEFRGVNALGARRKMLKMFEQVREAQANGIIE